MRDFNEVGGNDDNMENEKLTAILKLLNDLYPEKKVFSLDSISRKLESRIKNYIQNNNISSVEEFLNMYGYEKINAEAAHELRPNVKFLPGDEPPEIKENIDSILVRLAEYYPNKIIEKSIINEHKKLGEKITGIYLWLGYNNAAEFLKAYGYTYNANTKGGRPSTSRHLELLEYLKNKYKDNPLNNYDELKSLETDYAEDLDKYSKTANRLFGMSLNKKLVEQGILINYKEIKRLEKEEAEKQKMETMKKAIEQANEIERNNRIKKIFENIIIDFCNQKFYLNKGNYILDGMEQKIYNILYNYYEKTEKFPMMIDFYNQLSVDEYNDAIAAIKSLEEKKIIYGDFEGIRQRRFFKLFKEKYDEDYVIVKNESNLDLELEKTYKIIYNYYKENNEFPYAYELTKRVPTIDYDKIIQDLDVLKKMNIVYDNSKNKLDELMKRLHERYTNCGIKSKDIDSLMMENTDLPISKSDDWIRKLYKMSNEEYFYNEGILKKNKKMRLEEPDIKKNDLELENYIFKPEVYYVDEVNLIKEEANEWEYAPSSPFRNDIIDIKNYLGNSEHIIIPASIDGKRVTLVKITNPKVTTIEIPGSIKKVDLSLKSSNVKTLIIGEGIEEININIENISTIKASKSVVKVSLIGATRWKECQEDLIIIGSTFCGYNKDHEVLKVPEGIKSINNFVGNQKLKKVILPNSVTTINDYAFSRYSCSSLEEIVYTPSLVNFGYDVFSKEFLEKNNTEFLIINDMLVLSNVKEKNVVIPQGVKKICGYAFRNNNSIENIELPNSLTEIDKYAFEECYKLKSINIPDSVKKIGKYAFYQCEKLSEIKLSNNLEVIESGTFENCKKLSKITGLNSLKEIGVNAFAGCSKLKKIQLNNDMKIISKEAFKNCESLEEITLAEVVQRNAFENCTNLKTVHFNDNMKIVNSYTFANCINLKEVTFNDGLKEIGAYAFYNCSELNNVKLPSKLEKIDGYAFSKCKKLNEIYIDDSTIVNENAFEHTPYGKTILNEIRFGDFIISKGVLKKYLGKSKEVSIPDNVIIIDFESFEGCSTIEKLIIHNNVKEIKGALFGYKDIDDYEDNKDYEKNRPKLKTLIVGDGLEIIDNFAFYNCEDLEDVRFGNNLISIGDRAFANCKSLRKVDLSNTKIKEIGYLSFENCTSLNTLKLSDTIEVIEDSAFENVNLDIVHLPKTVKKVGKSSFSKTNELVIYDTIEPEGVMAREFKYDHLNGTINSSISTALINTMELHTECVGNTEWRDYHITVKSSVTDEIRYRIFCDSQEKNEYRVILFSGWGKNASFLFDDYDEYFKKTNDKENRIEMCFCRLMYPEGLTLEHRKDYENYFKRCMYIEDSCKRNALIVALEDNVERLELLDMYKTIDNHNIKWIREIFEENNATNCIKYLDKNLSYLGGN